MIHFCTPTAIHFSFFRDESRVKTSCSNESLQNLVRGGLQNPVKSGSLMLCVTVGWFFIHVPPRLYFSTKETTLGRTVRHTLGIFDLLQHRLNRDIYQ